MTKEHIAKLAAQNKHPPDMDPLDDLLWYWLHDVYAGFTAGTIDAETGAERKAEAIRRYETILVQNAVYESIVECHSKMWRELEQAVNRYNAERTLQNADKVIQTVYGLNAEIDTAQKER